MPIGDQLNPYLEMSGASLTNYFNRVNQQQNTASRANTSDTDARITQLEYDNSRLHMTISIMENQLAQYEEISKAQADLILDLKRRLDMLEFPVITLTN